MGLSSIRLCQIQPVLRRSSFEALQDLISIPLPDDVECLDMQSERVVVADEVVREKILQVSGVASITAFHSLDKNIQKKIVAMVMQDLQAGPRQMSRVSGLSYSVIQRLSGSLGQDR